jgi:importin-5
MAFSQIGEYLDNPEKVAPMIPVIIQHLKHTNPMIRFAALHSFGQLSEDMTYEFSNQFHKQVIPAMICALDDQYSRLVSHACAAFTNFLEFSEGDYVKPYA